MYCNIGLMHSNWWLLSIILSDCLAPVTNGTSVINILTKYFDSDEKCSNFGLELLEKENSKQKKL